MVKDDRIYHVGVMLGNIHTQHPKELIEGIYEAACGENVNVTLFLGAQVRFPDSRVCFHAFAWHVSD